MSLADWLGAGGDPAKMTPEEVRRRLNVCGVREEQAASRLESFLGERDAVFLRGAASRSPMLRKVLARRWARLDAEVRSAERELGRIGKEVAGLAVLKRLQKDSVALRAPGDCGPLLTALDDAGSSEDDFADRLRTAVSDAAAEPRSGPMGSPDLVLSAWDRMDRGEADAETAQRGLDERAQATTEAR